MYGDIEVTLKSEPRGTATHGYAELEFVVVNRSAQATRQVRLAYPKTSYGYGDHLRSVSRTVTVEPGKTVRVALAYPERLDATGSGTGVTIDGREQDDAVSVGRGLSSRGYSYRSGSSSGPQLLVLYSKSVDTHFPDWVVTSRFGMAAGVAPAIETVRADLDATEWSTNWLGYTRYDGVVVTAADLRAMPAEVRDAVGRYVECGGALLVLGRDPVLPGPWKVQPARFFPATVATPGFGQCVLVNQTDLTGSNLFGPGPVQDSWTTTAKPWRKVREPGEANRAFPAVDDVGVPVKGLLALMFVFAVVIGPVNLIVLARKKRKLWLFWTVPLVSFLTCLSVFAYMAVTEGWSGRARVEGFTVLDENSRRASSLGWAGFYTPLQPRGGLHFGPDTELTYQNGDDPYLYPSRRRGSGSALAIDWTREQHLASGWLTPRVPAHFAVRKSELRRERMTITKRPDGGLEAVNDLGTDLSDFWYADEKGDVFHAEGIVAGSRADLKPAPRPAPDQFGTKTLRNVYGGDWATVCDRAKTDGPALLAPRTYLGLMDGAPFLDDGLPGASVRKTRSAVYGILKEGGDGS